MTIKQKIKYHFDTRKFCGVKRKIGPDSYINTFGYIVDFSTRFILLQEDDDFILDGYSVIPISTIVEIRYNNFDKYFSKIMIMEKAVNNVSKKHNVDLNNWVTIFRTIKSSGLNVIVECEAPSDDDFIIGPISKVTKSAVYIQFIRPNGYLITTPTKVTFNRITIAHFDTRYVNTFSKYIRRPKQK